MKRFLYKYFKTILAKKPIPFYNLLNPYFKEIQSFNKGIEQAVKSNLIAASHVSVIQQNGYHKIMNGAAAKDILIQVLTKNNPFLKFDEQVFKEIPTNRLWVILNEIFLREDYFFETSNPNPKILDCGANIGMAVSYFKTKFPNSTVIAFEPIARFCTIINNNATLNNWQNVEVVNAAVGNAEDTLTFYESAKDPLGGSLTPRKVGIDDSLHEIKVPVLRLRNYLTETVDFLKLDTEGNEDLIIKDIEDLLPNVQSLFIEYHEGNGLTSDRLVTILHILEKSGYTVLINQNFSAIAFQDKRPWEQIADRKSLCIWAKRI